MKPISKSKMPKFVAKKLVLILSPILRIKRLNSFIRYFEAFIAAIQGKGSGSGWNLSGEVIAAISCIHSTSPIVIDVGANMGLWSKIMIEKNPSIKRLILIEPQKKCLPFLELINFSEKKILSIGLGDREEFLRLYESDNNTVSSLYPDQCSIFKEVNFDSQNVKIKTLDNIVDELGLTCIDFMKMDIEGHEMAALRGAEKSLSSGVVRALSFEFGGSNVASRTYFKDFWDFLTARKYSIFRILPGGNLLHIDEYYGDLEYFRGATNYIAMADSSTNRPRFNEA